MRRVLAVGGLVLKDDDGQDLVEYALLIALIALSRKFVILDLDAEPSKVAALAGAALALGITYWLVVRSSENAGDPHIRGDAGAGDG